MSLSFSSTGRESDSVDFKTAVLSGLAPDGGLYIPDEFNQLDQAWLDNLPGSMSCFADVASSVMTGFFGQELSDQLKLDSLIREALNFDVPLKKLDNNTYVLEQWHGPTGAFKDVGARVMARLFQAFTGPENPTTILVATSGDTGGAVANGFLGINGINVVILYPSGGVSELQEKQLTTLGSNVHAIEVDGTFDDCQRLVKEAFSDSKLKSKFCLSSANSINIARLLPQMLYYFRAVAQLPTGSEPPVFVVPSGNFGNICAGLYAERIGLPVKRFVAATNANDVIPQYLKNGTFKAKPSVKTDSNAMDVGDPSNRSRIEALFDNDLATIRSRVWAHTPGVTDQQTKKAIKHLHDKFNYVMDPHGAVGYTSLLRYRLETADNAPAIIFETAHPSKFNPVMNSALGFDVKIPANFGSVMKAKKKSHKMTASLANLRKFLDSMKTNSQ